MHFQDIAFALFASGAFAAPAALKVARDACSDACYSAYNTCRSAPDANRASCASDYATCLGYSPFDSNGSLVTPTACSKSAASSTPSASSNSIPGGCNPAHPGSCPSSYFSTSTVALPIATSIPGGCNPAHPGSCPSSYFSTSIVALPTATSIPGGCNPAHPGSCPSSYFSTTTAASSVATAPASADACASNCYDSYNKCRGAPDANRASCASDYASCLGYSPFDSNGSLVTPTACSSSIASTIAPAATSIAGIPGGCNPAHPGSCPSSYFSTVVTPTATSIAGIPGGCNPAHPGSCPSSYFSTSIVALPTATSIPGGCNPAHPGSCPSSYFSTVVTPTATSIAGIPGGCNPAHPGSCPPSSTAAPDHTSVLEGVTWTIKDLTRYCSEDGSGCDYNFAIATSDGRPEERCTVVRMPGKDATTESFYGIPCTTGSANTISWGISDQFGAENAFAVLTVTNNQQKANAYFGVGNVNSNPVTPSSPAGSGNFGDIGPEPIYTF